MYRVRYYTWEDGQRDGRIDKETLEEAIEVAKTMRKPADAKATNNYSGEFFVGICKLIPEQYIALTDEERKQLEDNLGVK